jgi:hypothetical protein
MALLVTRGIAELAGVATPVVDKVIAWAQEKLVSANSCRFKVNRFRPGAHPLSSTVRIYHLRARFISEMQYIPLEADQKA